jgi:hypothetical protein
MDFDIATFKHRTERLRWDDLDLTVFRSNPLDPSVLRCIRYMHDVEYHTICYLRDLLVSPAHSEPDVTAFLSIWAFEEYWHGEALAAVLEAHDELAGTRRVAAMRGRLGWLERLRPLLMLGGSGLVGRAFVATHMTWGAVNEWTTQAGYAQLGRRACHPVLSELVRRITRQEGRHIDFYASEAERRLGASSRARRVTRSALRRFWAPVGSGVMPAPETRHMADFLFGGEEGRTVVSRIDRRIDRLPGLGGLDLMARALDRTGNGARPEGGVAAAA